MQIKVYCPECLYADNIASKKGYVINDELLIDLVCENGHKIFYNISNFKHEILFEGGIHALKDGYYREALSSFAVALERYYEYATKVLLLNLPTHENHTETIQERWKKVDELWKKVARQSERQLGLFLSAWFELKREAPDNLKGESIELRNKCIHNGYIPTFEEALNFGKEVASLIKSYEIEITNLCGRGIMNYKMMFGINHHKYTTDKNGDKIHKITVVRTYLYHEDHGYYFNLPTIEEYIETIPS